MAIGMVQVHVRIALIAQQPSKQACLSRLLGAKLMELLTLKVSRLSSPFGLGIELIRCCCVGPKGSSTLDAFVSRDRFSEERVNQLLCLWVLYHALP